jgi:hypothetical protein
MRAADGFVRPRQSAAHAELERRYRRLLWLYPREFQARRGAEMLGVLMAGARDDQWRPAAGDVADIVRGSLLIRLRGPRGGWAPALAAFALLAPVFLVLTDILLAAFPYWESRAGAGTRWHIGGIPYLTQPGSGFPLLAIGPVLVAAAVLAGWRRTALATLIVAAAADLAQWSGLALRLVILSRSRAAGHLALWIGAPSMGGRSLDPSATLPYSLELVTITVFLLEAVALIAVDSRALRRRPNWRLAVPVLVLAVGVQAWALAFDSLQDSVPEPFGFVIAGFAFAGIALLLPLGLGLGWRVTLLLAAVCYPCALGVGWTFAQVHGNDYVGTLALSSLTPTDVLALYLPPLLTVGWGAVGTLRTARARGRGELA